MYFGESPRIARTNPNTEAPRVYKIQNGATKQKKKVDILEQRDIRDFGLVSLANIANNKNDEELVWTIEVVKAAHRLNWENLMLSPLGHKTKSSNTTWH